MNPFDPTNAFCLLGGGTMRGVTVALPSERARGLLPNGLELGPQTVTPPGTHPVLIGFNDMFRLHTSFPSLLPNLTYHELAVGVPFSYLSGAGPYYFMPQLFLDSVLAVLGGVMFWGFNKRVAKCVVTADSYTVLSEFNERITALAWTATQTPRPLREFPLFEPIRRMLCQPVISMMPGAIGPFFALSDFDKQWDVAVMRPLRTSMDVDIEYMPGFPGGPYPAAGTAPGIDETVLGSYELRVPWRLGMPYAPPLIG